MIYRYLLILIACTAVLAGIQIPNFIDQYEKRLDAHLIEVNTNLRGFQEVADRYHGGSMDALIREHEASESPTFKDEAKPLREMVARQQAFRQEQKMLNTHLAAKSWHIAVNGHPELLRETQGNYSYTVPLTEDAIITGAVFAGLILLTTEVIAAIVGLLFRRRRRQRMSSFR